MSLDFVPWQSEATRLRFEQSGTEYEASAEQPFPVAQPAGSATGYGYNKRYVSDTWEFDRAAITANQVGTSEVNIDPGLTLTDTTLTNALGWTQILLCCDHSAAVDIRVYGRLDDRAGTGWTRYKLLATHNLTGDGADMIALITSEVMRCHDYRITAQAAAPNNACKFVLRGVAG